jgi:hypothetical protein
MMTLGLSQSALAQSNEKIKAELQKQFCSKIQIKSIEYLKSLSLEKLYKQGIGGCRWV